MANFETTYTTVVFGTHATWCGSVMQYNLVTTDAAVTATRPSQYHLSERSTGDLNTRRRWTTLTCEGEASEGSETR